MYKLTRLLKTHKALSYNEQFKSNPISYYCNVTTPLSIMKPTYAKAAIFAPVAIMTAKDKTHCIPLQ